ncbi:CHAT domain-containing protein [Ekhidna sp.]
MKSLVPILVLFATSLFGQNDLDTDLLKSEQAYKKGNYDSALFYLDTDVQNESKELLRLKIYWKQGELEKSLTGINQFLSNTQSEEVRIGLTLLKGKVLFSKGQPMLSVELMDSLIQSISTPEHLAEAINTKSKSLIWAGESSKASVVNDKADSIYEANDLSMPILLGNIYNVNGILFYFSGDFDQAIKYFELAIDEKKKVLSTTHPDIIALFGNTGVMYKNKQEYDKALKYYGFELENYAKTVGADHPLVATTYQNIGNIYGSKAEYDLALEAFDKSLKIRQEKLGEENPLTLDIYEWIGNIYADMGEYDQAQTTFEKVLEGRIENFGEENHFVSLTYYNLGEIFYLLGRYELALSNFKKAANIGESVYEEKSYEHAGNYNGIAMSLDKLGEFERARKFYFLSLQQSFPNYQWNGDATQPPRIINYLRFDEVFISLIGLARSHAATANHEALKTSLKFVATSRNLIDLHKRSLTNKSDQVRISRSAKELADIAIEINYKLYQQTNEEQYLASIFQWSEYVKGTTLLNTISDQKAKQFSGIPDSLLDQEYRFRLQKDSLKTLISESNEENGNANLISSLLELETDHENFIAVLERQYPRYSELKYGLKPISFHEISKSIYDSDQAIVQYFVSEQRRVFASIITKNNHMVVTSNCQNLLDQIGLFRKSLDEIDQPKFENYSKELFKSIFQPIEENLAGIKNLTIIPDGILGYIPFELLIDSEGKYLLESYQIKYDLSSTMLAQRVDENSSANKLLAYAPEFGTTDQTNNSLIPVRSNTLEALPGAIKEVENIKTVLSSELRIGSLATESLFKSESKKFDVLHLATHSIINERDPNYTKLMFAPDEKEDGALHIYELENLTLNAQLVTLSACNTGIGKIAEGEGVMSLARSFRSVGVPSVVMSLWPASDKSTPKLMQYFYQNLKDGQSKDLALNNARKQYLSEAEGKSRHPFYWGGFVLIGDNSPIQTEQKFYGFFIPILLTFVMIVVLYSRGKSRAAQ